MTTEGLSSTRYGFDDLREAMEFYFEQGWTDGLPVVPPAEKDVRSFLERTNRNADEVLGIVPVNNRAVTVEKVAINAVMAGCRPEYMPVVIAAVEAVLDPAFNLHTVTVSTSGRAVGLLINGPVRRALEFNSGLGLMGPGHRANATVGRAIRLIQINVCGATIGALDRSNLGHPGQYTMCIAEDEEFSAWEPFHVTQGYAREDSTVTAFACLSPLQITSRYGDRPEDILTSYADAMLGAGSPNQAEVLVIIPQQFMEHIKRVAWSRRQVQEFLYQAAQRPAREWARAGQISSADGEKLGEEPIHCCRSPEGFHVIPAGGNAGMEGAIIYLTTNTGAYRDNTPGTRTVIRKIETSRL